MQTVVNEVIEDVTDGEVDEGKNAIASGKGSTGKTL